MSSYKSRWNRFIRSIWLFPAVLTALLVLFTVLGINGSSIGTYHELFYGKDAKDPNLILSEPRAIRSDEWLVNTQLTIAQEINNFKQINPNIGNGHDMSLAVDVPYKDWSIIFKPHNLPFLILPFDNAFAFKWWSMAYLLILSCYFFVLALLPGRRLWATLISLTIFFNPFVQWWYLFGTMAPIYYSLFAAVVFMKLLNTTRRLHTALWAVLFAYLLACFALILYPPFQIPVALVMASFGLAYVYKGIKDSSWKEMAPRLGAAALAALVAGAIVFTFLAVRHDEVSAIRNTVYPAKRIAFSGEEDGLVRTFSAPLSFALQNERDGAKYFTNYYTSQSEAAEFIKLNLIFAPFVLLALYRNPTLRRTLYSYLFIATSIVLFLFAIRIFTPFFDLPFRFLLLHQVQNERLEIGFLLLCIIQLALLGGLLLKAKGELMSKKMALAAGIVGVALFGDASLSMAKEYPQFISQKYLIIVAVMAVGATIYLLLRRRAYIWGLALFLIINVVSSITINPLYSRAQPEVLESLTNRISTKYKNDKSWAVFDHLVTENIAQMAGKSSLTGVYSYPQLDLWRTLDPKGRETDDYNRYAHVAFTVTANSDGGHFINPQSDVVLISFDCEMAKKLPNFGYALSPLPIKEPHLQCLTQEDKLEYPNLTLYIYKYSPLSN